GAAPVTTRPPPRLFSPLSAFCSSLLAAFSPVGRRDGRGRGGAVRGGAPATPTLRLWAIAIGAPLALLIAALVSLKLLLLLLLAVGLFLALNPRHSAVKLLTYVLLLLGVAIALGVEQIYVRDFLESPWNRMNTVFKFYFQVWTLLALGGTLALTLLFRRFFGRGPVQPIAASEPEIGARSSLREWAVGGLPLWGDAYSLSRAALRGIWLFGLLALLAASSVFL